MPKLTVRRVVLFVIAVVLVGSAYLFLTRKSAEEWNYKSIYLGMPVERVEAILGPGEQVPQSEVPSFVAAANPDEEVAFVERHRKAGTVPTARTYTTRYRYFVEGDVICHWQSRYYDIWIAFKDGKVYEKRIRNRNYLQRTR